SPLAKKLAAEKGIDLSGVSGSGDNGRIVRKDIENFQGGSQPSQRARAIVAGKENYTEEAVSQMRKTIARRLSESKFNAPHFYLTMEIDMDQSIAARKAINEAAQTKVSFNDIIIRAAAAALRKHP